jgi:hypothetical protein
MSEFILTINNKEVFEFYEKHAISFEHMNILFCGILKSIITDMDQSLNQSVATKLMSELQGINKRMHGIEHVVENVHTAISTTLSIKFSEYRKEYISDLKMMLASNNVEHITPLIRDTNNHLIDKTALMLNELVPKNNELMSKEMNVNFKLLQSTILTETSKFLSSSLDKKTMDDFVTNIHQSMTHSHNTLTSIIATTESRIDTKLSANTNKIEEIKTVFTDNNRSQHILQTSVTEMLKKFEKGIGKGNVSEHVTYNILLSLYPCAQIDHVGSEVKETGDIMLTRNGKPKILIENKDHDSCNIPKHEVDKFIRDCDIQKCCGIMLAQNRGIANKRNFELQINNGNVLLYVHNVNFDVDKIKTAVELVEQFKLKLDEVNLTNDNNNYIIENEVLEQINSEFQGYIQQKHALLKIVREFNDKMNVAIDCLKMPIIETFLSDKFASSAVQGRNVCVYCEKYVAKSMSSHHRYCQVKNKTAATLNETADTKHANK